MKHKFTLLTTFISPLLLFSSSLLALDTNGQDTCGVNDFCETAILVPGVFSDGPFVCLEGCNLNASPEMFNNECQIGVFPTVWYQVFTDGLASSINIFVNSSEIESPVITLCRIPTDCDEIIQVPITQSFLPCLVGSNGAAEALVSEVWSNSVYYIAVSSLNSPGGSFNLCVNTISGGSNCVIDRRIVVTDRSADESLDGPFYPGETVSICLEVNSYTAANNGCQWFQGLVPVFGNGWDPSSFDPDGQPINATINGNLMGQWTNGLYGEATWDWFSDVDYHYDDPFRNVGDIDGNGYLDMCNILYDPYCPNLGGLNGGCCNPCWGAPLGTILPPGWFAYGINGSCPHPGPPVRVDWGDGNTCGGGMGPWRFCFDLQIRPFPECMTDSTYQDLSLSFFTFADGETGAWTGNASICALDQPARIRLPLSCGQQTDLGIEFVEDKCADDIFNYVLDETDIVYWTWYILPSGAVKPSPKQGDNGYIIHDTLINQSTAPIELTYYFTGYEQGEASTVVKEVRFRIIPEIQSSLPGIMYACEKDTDSLIISSLPLSGGLPPYTFLWSPGGETSPAINVIPPFQSGSYAVNITDSIGCSYQKEILFKVQPCHLDTIVSEDESNETHTYEDGPIGNGNLISPSVHHPIGGFSFENNLRVYPVPATDRIHVEWAGDIDDASTLIVYDIQGQMMYQAELSKQERDIHRTQINVREYVDGVYLVILQTKQSILASRLIKM